MDTKQSVLESLDGFDMELYPYLPYILQDLWILGADPESMLSLVRKHIRKAPLNVLDLGCGKGAVSIPMAKELQCRVKGIDGMEAFIHEARKYAVQYNVHNLCSFESGDLRDAIKHLNGYDVIILGAIGPVLGNLHQTLVALKPLLNKPGYVIMDDGYLDDDSTSTYDRCPRKSEFYRQLAESGFTIIEEMIYPKDFVEDMDNEILELIRCRIDELKMQFPEKSPVFEAYLKSQKYETNIIEYELTGGIWLLQY